MSLRIPGEPSTGQKHSCPQLQTQGCPMVTCMATWWHCGANTDHLSPIGPPPPFSPVWTGDLRMEFVSTVPPKRKLRHNNARYPPAKSEKEGKGQSTEPSPTLRPSDRTGLQMGKLRLMGTGRNQGKMLTEANGQKWKSKQDSVHILKNNVAESHRALTWTTQ